MTYIRLIHNLTSLEDLGAATCKLVNFVDHKVLRKSFKSPLEVLQKSFESPLEVLQKSFESPLEVLQKSFGSPSEVICQL